MSKQKTGSTCLNTWFTWFTYYFNKFDSCLSEHAKDDTDGRLSMWRGYGGNGNGAAIVFDTAKIAAREESPLVIAHVHYGTGQMRENWLQRCIAEFGEILAKSEIPDDKLSIAAYYFFERLKLFAIFTKHRGFLEENEWRVVYMRDRDRRMSSTGCSAIGWGRGGSNRN